MREIDITNQTEFAIEPALFNQTANAILDHFQVEQCEVSFALIDDASMHALNRQFLGHDYPTDVLTFPGTSSDANFLDGEIVVSVDTAKRLANELNLDVLGEVLLYFIHGMLHLLGLDDQSEPQALKMREFEKKFLELAGFSYCFELERKSDKS